MDLTLSPAEREFRDSVRGWIEDNHPGREPAGDPEAFEFRRAWQKALNERGWDGLSWPTEYGGARARLGRPELADRVRRGRRDARRAGDLLRGDRPRGSAADGERARPRDGRADRHRP